MARFVDFKKDVGFADEVYRLLTCEAPRSLAEIARELRVPKGEFTRWFQVEHAELYDSALKSVTDEMIFAAKRLLDDATEENAAVVKVKVDGFFKLASKWDRQRYGETVRVEKSLTFGVDAALLGTASDLLRLVASGARPMRVIEELPAPPPETVVAAESELLI